MPSLRLQHTVEAFWAGQPLAQYTLAVPEHWHRRKLGDGLRPDTPAGLNATALSGNGWSCSIFGMICSRSDSLPSGSSYAPIALIASVASYTSGTLTNQATLSGGGSSTSTASDPTNIAAAFVDVLPSDSFLPAIDLLKECGDYQPAIYKVRYSAQTTISAKPRWPLSLRRSGKLVATTSTTRKHLTSRTCPLQISTSRGCRRCRTLNRSLVWNTAVLPGCTRHARQYGSVDYPGPLRGADALKLSALYLYFTDVPASHPFFAWIQKCVSGSQRVVRSTTTYRPDRQ